MGYQVQQAAVALQVGAQIHFPVDDFIEVMNGVFIITAAKIKTGDFIIEYQDAMPVNI